MSNVITTVGHGLKVAAEDTAHVAEAVVGTLPKAAEVLAAALKDEPQIKAAVLALIEQGSTIAADGAIDVASKGTDLVADAATITACEAFCSYFKSTFIPAVADLISEVKQDIATTA